jgi:hypothetical protein
MTLLETALEIGEIEYELGAGEEGTNNSGPFVHKYLNELAEPPANWCAAFVCWCIREACNQFGIEMPFEYTLSARRIFNIFRNNGWIVEQHTEPIPGDLIFFWRGDVNGWMGHVGFVKDTYEERKISEIDGSELYKKIVKTLEGNKGYFPARVNHYKYDYAHIPQFLGFGRLK